MPIVRATLTSVADIDELERLYLFELSAQDQRLLGIDRTGGIRHYDRATTSRIQADRSRLAAEAPRPGMVVESDPADERFRARTSGFALRLPFDPTSPKANPNSPTPAGFLPPLEALEGRDFYILVGGPFRTAETYRVVEGPWRGEQLSVWEGAGIYPCFTADDSVEDEDLPLSIQQATAALAERGYQQYANDAIPSLFDDLAAQSSLLAVSTLDIDYWMRVFGVAIGMATSPFFLRVGESFFEQGGGSITEFYRLWELTSDTGQFVDRSQGSEDDFVFRSRLFAADHFGDRPLLTTAIDLSNPTLFGSPGCLFPAAFLANPYSMVGPASSPGINQRLGGGLSRRLPFWTADLVARAIYEHVGPDHPSRAAAIVFETARHLEERNGIALRRLTARGNPMREDDSFNFDMSGLSPAGSIIFSRSVIDGALARRYQDLSAAVTSGRRTHVGTGTATNPYPAVAGFLGVTMPPVHELVGGGSPVGSSDPRHDVLCRVLREVHRPPGQTRKPDRWYGIRERIDFSEEALGYLRQQELPGLEQVLPVDPPALPELQELSLSGLHLDASQSAALRMVMAWRFSMIIGDPGTGKSTLTRELEQLKNKLNDSSPGNQLFFLILTPKNIVTRAVAELHPHLFVLGSKGERGHHHPAALAGGAVGTVDSFIRTMETDSQFAEHVQGSRVFLIFEEVGLLTTPKFVGVMRALDPDVRGNPIRCVFTGDRLQLEAPEPGDFAGDAQAVLPITRLTTSHRHGVGADLNGLLDTMRDGLTSSEARRDVVARLIRVEGPHHALQVLGHPTPQRGDAYWDLQRGQLCRWHGHDWVPDPGPPVPWDESLLRVTLIDDLPSGALEKSELNNQDVFDDFRLELDRRVREAVFGEVLDWSRMTMEANNIPGVTFSNAPRKVRSAGASATKIAAEDYARFAAATLTPPLPFTVITMVRTLHGPSPFAWSRTHYVSSTERVNGWFVDALLGRLPPDDPQTDPAMRGGIPYNHVGDPRIWYFPPQSTYDTSPYLVDYSATLARMPRRREQQLFLSDYRPRQITLGPGWPYYVESGDFRQHGVIKGERITYLRTVRVGGRHRHVFKRVTGEEFQVDVQHATHRHLSYGWATNVQRLQGTEVPLVILVWVDGVSPVRTAMDWDRIRPTLGGPRDPLPSGHTDASPLDHPTNLRGQYTAATRVHAAPTITTYVQGQPVVQEAKGRLVVIAGRHSLRRYLGAELVDRVTAAEALLRESMSR